MITLVLGGVRSGKSEVAERLAGPGPVTYLATGIVRDPDFSDRVARHRARRPAAWSTVEEGRAVPALLARLHGSVLVDALGTWVANDLRLDMAFEGSVSDIDALVDALVTRDGDTILVSEEVGLGVHPATELGRRFADVLGEVNRRVAEVADRVLLVVAGRTVELPAGRAGDEPPVPPAAGPSGPAAAPPEPAPAPPELDRLEHPAPPSARNAVQGALAFLTPLGGAAAPGPAALGWFPVVGAVLGLALGGLWALVDGHLGALTAAALIVTADLAATGALHFDGLVDSADGLLPHLDRPRRLAVMAEPGVGAFGVAAGGSALLLRAGSLAALGSARPLLLASLWAAARTSMAIAARVGTYARPSGLATAFRSGNRTGPLVLTATGAAAAAVLAVLDDPLSLVALVAGAAGGALVHDLARRRLGGFTGDTLGAAGVVTETVGLLAAVAVLS